MAEKTNIKTKGFACVQFYKTKSTAKTVLLKSFKSTHWKNPGVDSWERLIITPSKCVVGVHTIFTSAQRPRNVIMILSYVNNAYNTTRHCRNNTVFDHLTTVVRYFYPAAGAIRGQNSGGRPAGPTII